MYYMQKITSFFTSIWSWIKARFQTKRSKIVATVVVIVGIILLLTHKPAPVYQFVAVTKGPITETVSITGNTMPVQSVSLGFGSTGTVNRTYAVVGKNVRKGNVLAQLSAGDLYAQAKQAEAVLAGLQAGSRPEDVAASEAALDKSKQDLANLYASISDVSNTAYASANDAVRTLLDPLYFDDETPKPQLTYTTSFPVNTVITERINATTALNGWVASPSESTINKNVSDLEIIRQLISDTGKTLDGSPVLPDATIATYKSAVGAAQSEVNTVIKSLNTLSQSIASQKLTIAQLQSQLNLKKAGSTPQDIMAQEAAVQSIYARLDNTRIVAPIDGVVTQFDAKIGQLATTGTPLVAIISDKAFEVEGLISEIDIGKVAVGNMVSMTLDAFPGETFSGVVFYIDPAQTTSEGVVGYKIKVNFDKADPRMKSGLTANIDIKTRSKSETLILPQYAVLQNDTGIFVQKLVGQKPNGKGGTVTDVPVTLGLSDQDGNVEILSGVSEGEQVINIGLKQK